MIRVSQGVYAFLELSTNQPTFLILSFFYPIYAVMLYPTVFSNFILSTVTSWLISYAYKIPFQFKFGFTKESCLIVIAVSLINSVGFSGGLIFRFTKQFTQCVFHVECRSDTVRFQYTLELLNCVSSRVNLYSFNVFLNLL